MEEIAFDVSDGRGPYQAWRGLWMVGQQYANLSELERFGPNLRGNVEAGLKVTAIDIAAAEQKRLEVFHRFRKLFERFDVLLTPAAPVKPFPVEMNFPTEINGQKFENYIEWIAPAFLVTLVSLPAGSVPAGMTADGLPVGMQVVAPRFEEPLILRVAKLVQQSSGVGWPPHGRCCTMMRVIPGRAVGASPESITTACDYGFRARRYAASRNDDSCLPTSPHAKPLH